MAFDPDQFLAQTSTATAPSGFDPDQFLKETEPKSLGGFAKNAVEDVKGTAQSLFGEGGLGERLMDHPIDTTASVVKGLPGAVVNEGKRLGVGELLTGHPVNAAQKFGQALYDKPVTTGLEIAPALGAAGRALGLGEEAASAAQIAKTAAQDVAEAAPKAEESTIGKIASNVPTGSPAPPPPTVPFSAEAKQATQKAKEVGDYIGKRYERFAGQPNRVSDIADYIQEKSQMMANQQLGATPLQARQVGHEGMRAIGQYALDNDIVTPTNGIRGMRAQNDKLLNAAGEKLGAFRKEADSLREPTVTPIDVMQEVRNRLDAKYARGAYAGQSGAYQSALQDLEDAEPTFEGQANVATKLNQAANKANRLNQPHQPFTDVANVVSELNNERIKSLLGPEKAAQYEQALREYGVNKKISAFLERKAAGEVKRLGPGSLTSNMTQKLLDEIGYKVGARAANKTATAVLKNPSVSRTLPSLFKEFIHHVDEVAPGSEGMAHGGIVPEGLDGFLEKKYGKKGD